MYYFNTLPKITQSVDNYTVSSVNLVARNYFITNLLKQVTLFYDYDIKEIDSPDNMADRYYRNSYRYWLFMYANNSLHPQWDWPLTPNQFEKYLLDKYQSEADKLNVSVLEYAASTFHHYEKDIITTDSNNLQTQVITIQIDEEEYNNITDLSEKVAVFNDGTIVKKTIQKREISVYDYEYQTNEDKRRIKILNSNFVSQAEKEFEKLMAR
jgi:hypothetical protein